MDYTIVKYFIFRLIGVIIRNSDGEAIFGFVNNLLVHLNEQGLNFISTGIFGVFTIYLLWCVQKGNLSFGIRIPFIMSFHPMKKN
jgi:LMBR1 domain-containing protein 1